MATTNSQIVLPEVPRHTALRVEIVTSGLPQYLIAQRVQLSEGQLSKVLRGRRPLNDKLEAQIRAAIAMGAAS